MENATKALLIAAAILVAILIISLSLYVYRMASDTVGSVNLSEAEMATHNGKFESAAGARVSGSAVNALFSTIVTNNAAPDCKAQVTTSVTASGQTSAGVDASGVVTKVNTGKYYKVTLTYTAGLVTTVTVADV